MATLYPLECEPFHMRNSCVIGAYSISFMILFFFILKSSPRSTASPVPCGVRDVWFQIIDEIEAYASSSSAEKIVENSHPRPNGWSSPATSPC